MIVVRKLEKYANEENDFESFGSGKRKKKKDLKLAFHF